MRFCFRIYDQNEQWLETKFIEKGIIRIGTKDSADLRLEHESVSRMQAVIEVLDDKVRLIDLGSRCGTYTHDRETKEKSKIDCTFLNNEDVIYFGEQMVRIDFE